MDTRLAGLPAALLQHRWAGLFAISMSCDRACKYDAWPTSSAARLLAARIKVAGTLINMHNIHNLWSPQKCASVNSVQTGLCVETTEINSALHTLHILRFTFVCNSFSYQRSGCSIISMCTTIGWIRLARSYRVCII